MKYIKKCPKCNYKRFSKIKDVHVPGIKEPFKVITNMHVSCNRCGFKWDRLCFIEEIDSKV